MLREWTFRCKFVSFSIEVLVIMMLLMEVLLALWDINSWKGVLAA